MVEPGALLAGSVLDAAFAGVTVGEPRSWRGLTLYPLCAAQPRPSACETLGRAIAAGTFRITEISEAGVVGRLRAHNHGSRPVLLLDGEEVVGAKQDRVLNLTILVPAHTELEIPVSCVEQGRWHVQSQTLREAGRAMFASGRARKARHVTESLRLHGFAAADQGAVWADVAERLDALGVTSGTAAMGAVYHAHRTTLAGYVAAFLPAPAQVGAVYALGSDVIGLELFDAPETFRASAAKLIQSYACDLLARRPPDASPAAAAACALVAQVRALTPSLHVAAGAGTDIRFQDEVITGGGLLLEDALVHLFAFRTSPPNAPLPPDSPADARTLIRDGLMHCEPSEVFECVPPALEVPGGVLRDRIQGMLVGLAIGDALGNTSEGMLPGERRTRYGEIRDYLPNPHAGQRQVGLPSDDTQLTFWTLRRLLEDRALVPENLARELCSARIFGIGSTVRAFIRAFKDEGRPWATAGQSSAGNGALMRIAPVLLPHLRRPSPRLWSDAAVAGMITHNDPASSGACVAFIELLWTLLGTPRGQPERIRCTQRFVDTLRQLEGEVARYRPRAPHLGGDVTHWAFVRRQVVGALEGRLEPHSWYSGAYLLETLPSVLFILERYGHDPETAIVRAVNDTKDNDTAAALVGAAVGARHGLSALPERWVRGLSGRTHESDDGEVFRLAARAVEEFGPA